MSDDLVKRMYEAFNSYEYVIRKKQVRIKQLEAALREILFELSDKDAPSWLGHGVMAMIATNALEGKKAND